jgi:hypothetical protein
LSESTSAKQELDLLEITNVLTAQLGLGLPQVVLYPLLLTLAVS